MVPDLVAGADRVCVRVGVYVRVGERVLTEERVGVPLLLGVGVALTSIPLRSRAPSVLPRALLLDGVSVVLGLSRKHADAGGLHE